jgi:hypothetical protein
MPRLKREYIWAKSAGRCWYCGTRLYHPEHADTVAKRRCGFTADHFHPRSQGGRGRANKVPACKYCNSHKSSRSVEQFRHWIRAQLLAQARGDITPATEHPLRRWKITAEAIVFYFELAQLPTGSAGHRPDCALLRELGSQGGPDFTPNGPIPLRGPPMSKSIEPNSAVTRCCGAMGIHTHRQRTFRVRRLRIQN